MFAAAKAGARIMAQFWLRLGFCYVPGNHLFSAFAQNLSTWCCELFNIRSKKIAISALFLFLFLPLSCFRFRRPVNWYCSFKGSWIKLWTFGLSFIINGQVFGWITKSWVCIICHWNFIKTVWKLSWLVKSMLLCDFCKINSCYFLEIAPWCDASVFLQN